MQLCIYSLPSKLQHFSIKFWGYAQRYRDDYCTALELLVNISRVRHCWTILSAHIVYTAHTICTALQQSVQFAVERQYYERLHNDDATTEQLQLLYCC
jgi:hypothetical protein